MFYLQTGQVAMLEKQVQELTMKTTELETRRHRFSVDQIRDDSDKVLHGIG